ncbi:hypothetical protein JCM8208_007839 [Rhodotorula glutinis]
MAQAAPPYLAHDQAHRDLDSPRLGSIAPPDPASLDTAAKRTSYRPPIPPKPPSRTTSPASPPHNMGPGTSTAGDDDLDAQATPPSRETSPTLWMRAMARDRGTSTPSPPPSNGDARSAGARTPRSARGSPMLGGGDGGSPSPSRTFPSRPSPRIPPAVPPRPVNLSSPTARPAPADGDVFLDDAHHTPSSSCPQTLSPFAALHASDAHRPIPTITTSPSRSPDRWRSRPPQHPSAPSSSSSTLSSSASYNSSLNTSSTTSALNALGRGLQQAKLKDRLGAGVGFARDWGGRGKGKLQDGWRGLQTHRAAASVSGAAGDAPYALASPPLGGAGGSSPLDAAAAGAPGGGPGALRLPTTILGVRVPNERGVAFGAPLVPLVERTRAPARASGGSVGASLAPSVVVQDGEEDDDPVAGSSARYWLPGAAFRLLEYLELWGPREEGVYRVPGRSHMVAQLRCMYDAGAGQELDLREIGPADLDPHAVASAFKGWLREVPDPLLSHQLEPTIDALTTAALGHPASSSHFLSGATALPSRGNSPAASPNPASAHVPPDYVAQLRTLFTSALPAEHFYLLRAIAFHLARLAAHEHTNKMSLNNLRLILSPTLRFSPGFLSCLVGEREALFGGGNDDGRARRAADASSTSTSAPSLAHASSSSSSLSTSRSFAGDRWLVIDEPPLSLSPTTALTSTSSFSSRPSPTHLSSSDDSIPTSTRSPSPQQTPIADRFASASTSPVSSIVAPPPPRGASPAFSASSTAPVPAPKPSLPPRDRPDSAAHGPVPSRGPSANTSTSPTSSPPLAAAPSPNRGSTPRLSLGPEFRTALAGLDGPLDAPAPAAGLTSGPSSCSSAAAAASVGGPGDQEALEREKDKARKKARRESRALSGVGGMPLGVGLGFVTRPPVRRVDEDGERREGVIAEGDEDTGEAAATQVGSEAAQRWTLLSVDERRRLFGG